MSFSSYNGIVRKYGRKLVLPVENIKRIIDKIFEEHRIDYCVDFGAGTMFWTEYLSQKCNNTYAVDVIYDNKVDMNGISFRTNIQSIEKDGEYGLVFMSDVLHHLDKSIEDDLFYEIMKKKNYSIIVVKDIDCNRKLGNYMNKLHDLVINGERIRDINPNRLMNLIQSYGYTCKLISVPKLWYPHFILIAVKEGTLSGNI